MLIFATTSAALKASDCSSAPSHGFAGAPLAERNPTSPTNVGLFTSNEILGRITHDPLAEGALQPAAPPPTAPK